MLTNSFIFSMNIHFLQILVIFYQTALSACHLFFNRAIDFLRSGFYCVQSVLFNAEPNISIIIVVLIIKLKCYLQNIHKTESTIRY